MYRFLTPIAVAVAVTGMVDAAELQSGLSVGAAAGAFNVKDITGPNKGTSLCYR